MLKLVDYDCEKVSYVIGDDEFVSKDEVEGWIILEMIDDCSDRVFLDTICGEDYNLKDLMDDELGEVEKEIGINIRKVSCIRAYLEDSKIFITSDFYGVAIF